MRQAVLLVLLLLSLPLQPAGPLSAQSATRAFSQERVGRIDRVLQSYVDENRLAGIVALVLHDGVPIYERAFGWSDKEAGRKMTVDAIFRIASQTKAITSVAILALMEDGKLGINDPVSRYIPSFAKTTVAVHGGGAVTFEPAKRAITIRDLLTHTAGVWYGTSADVAALYEAKGLGPAAGFGWYTADKTEPICSTMERLGTLPFVARAHPFAAGGCPHDDQSGRHLALDRRVGLWLRLRDHRPLRRGWHAVTRVVRLGWRLRIVLPCRPTSEAHDGRDAATDSESLRHS